MKFNNFIKSIDTIKGARVYDVNSNNGTFKIGLSLPGDKSELIAIIDFYKEENYLDVDKVPDITPYAFLKVNEVFEDCELQTIRSCNYWFK